MNSKQLVIITGMSGAGKTSTMQIFEDLGYFCIDNMPVSLLNNFLQLARSNNDIYKIALVVDLRLKSIDNNFTYNLKQLSERYNVNILFLDASNKQLVSRYNQTRRNHPLARNGRIIDGISRERKLLQPIKQLASSFINTTNLNLNELKKNVMHNIQINDAKGFNIEIMSFGFKYGLPIDADIIMDVRFLANPFYINSLKNHTGLDKNVHDYVMNQPKTKKFYNKLFNLLTYTLPGYKKEGKSNLTIGIGCTGGQHRSVVIANKLFKDLQEDGYSVNINHRDIQKRNGGY